MKTSILRAVQQLYHISAAAKKLDAKRTTIQSAVERGEIDAYPAGDGTTLVLLSEVEAWHSRRHERGPGRKPKNGLS